MGYLIAYLILWVFTDPFITEYLRYAIYRIIEVIKKK